MPRPFRRALFGEQTIVGGIKQIVIVEQGVVPGEDRRDIGVKFIFRQLGQGDKIRQRLVDGLAQALLLAADIPVFAGVGGGLTQGQRVVNLAMFAEMQGATGVVLNAPTANAVVQHVAETIDIPVVVTVARADTDFEARLQAGANIFNVSAAAETTAIVRSIRERYPDVPIIATGGPTDESILETIQAGANAITWTPPSNGEIFRDIMAAYRDNKPHP